MTVLLDGGSLTLDEVVRVARGAEDVELAAAALERVQATRALVERALARGDTVYGMTTGVGARKRVAVPVDQLETFNRMLIASHRTGQGPFAAPQVVRAALLRLANGFASGTAGVRLELLERIVRALNEGEVPKVRMLGSIGQADLAPMADLAHGLFAESSLAAKEGLALLSNNAFSTALAALAVADAARLARALEAAGALDLEAFAANPSALHRAVGETRPYPGLRASLERLRALLAGSYLWSAAPRNLQDPLTFRCLAQIQGALRDALAFAEGQLAVELNASQENPLVVAAEDRIVSVGNFDVLPLAAALDFVRIALAPALTSAGERAVKLLQGTLTGLPDGLAVRPGVAEDSLAALGVAAQAFVAEGRLLAQPVSFELATSTDSEGIEDRMTMAPLAARRLAEMVELGARVLSVELTIAAQAVELRGPPALGAGTRRAYDLVRERVAFMEEGETLPQNLESLRELVPELAAL
jgi:histidine ammonia-lyase